MYEGGATAEEIDIQDAVLAWTASISRPVPDVENRRRRPPEKHPLLKEILEAEAEDLKHADYVAHILIQRQARRYAFAVEDVLRTLRNGTKSFNENNTLWRTDNCKESPCSTATLTNEDGVKNKEDLTQFGRKIVLISEALKYLQEENALTFWTSSQRVTVLQQLVSFSKDAVKLRRKLARIKGSLEDRVRNVRRIAIKCECEITGNLVPSEIYYQWVKEDSTLYKTNIDNATHYDSQQNLSKVKATMSSMKKAAKSLMACVQPSDFHSASDSGADSSSSSPSTTNDTSLHPVGVYQMDIEILHQFCTNDSTDQDADSVCDVSLKYMESTVMPAMVNSDDQQTTAYEADMQLEDICTPKPSQKYLETIASNCIPPQKFNAYEYIYDHCESRIKEATENPCPALDLADEMNNQNHVISSSSDSNILEHQLGWLPVAKKEVISLPVNSEVNDNSFPITPPPKPVAQKLISESMEHQINMITNATASMHDVVTRITHAVRGMEREWVSPETMLKSRASGKEFFQLIDFIVETAKLTEDPTFASRLYPEDRDEIVSVLDPVLRELTNCFMSLHSLHSLIAVDVHYLKELVSGYPKGSLVIRDWVSDPSIDEDLGEMEHQNSPTDLDVDVDELFA